MTDSNDCNTVITIPQTRETCWFNSILMSLFYSQYSRKLLINTNSFSREKNELDVILNMMISYLYKYDANELVQVSDDSKAQIFYNLYDPTYILKLLRKIKYENKSGKKVSILNKDEYEKIIVKEFGNNAISILPRLIDYMSKKSIIVNYFDNKFFLHKRQYEKKVEYDNYQTASCPSYEEYRDFINEQYIPDYILINVIDPVNNPFYDENNMQHMRQLNITHDEKSSIQLTCQQNKNHPFIDVENYKIQESIQYRGNRYKLDSCLITNHNKTPDGDGHSIVGITCNNNRYLYNGWLIKDTRPQKIKKSRPPPPSYESIVSQKPPPPSYESLENKKGGKFPCELMKFDWLEDNIKDFCLNTESCIIDDVKSEDYINNLCYSFDKNDRTYIYVLDNDADKAQNTNIEIPDIVSDDNDTNIADLTKSLNEHYIYILTLINSLNVNIEKYEDEEDKEAKQAILKNINEFIEDIEHIMLIINKLDSSITKYKTIKAIKNIKALNNIQNISDLELYANLKLHTYTTKIIDNYEIIDKYKH